MPNISAATLLESIQFKEAAAPGTPASGYAALYVKTDGKLYIKDDAGTETEISQPKAAAFGAGTSVTVASGQADATNLTHIVVSAENSTSDDLYEVTGMTVGVPVIIRAAASHTITVYSDGAGIPDITPTDAIYLLGSSDVALSGNKVLKLVKLISGTVVRVR